MEKICFVIMGFGKKTDPFSGRTLDLDKTYKNLIRPAAESVGYHCVRADEIKDSGTIDKSMYTLLIKADLVIADISTFNPNAIYELGIRHAVKPYSTIVIKEEDGKIPFDLDHTRFFMYKHLGEDLGADESRKGQERLKSLIKQVKKASNTDSPMYEYMNINPPAIDEDDYKLVIAELAETTEHVFAISKQAKIKMENEEFEEASNLWGKASNILPNEEYFVQQHALCKYKSQKPSKEVALQDGLKILHKINIENDTNDPETLGIAGAINRRLYQLNGEIEYLNRAIESYSKGFKIREDYYNGENYAFCLNLKADIEKNKNEMIYYKIEAKKTREKIIKKLESLSSEELLTRADEKWIYATLSTCYLAIGNSQKSSDYEELFMSKRPETWEIETFKNSRKTLTELLK